MTKALRTFIAIELESDIQHALHLVQEDLKESGADVKWVIEENIHLTLKFLGDVPEDKIDEVKKIVKFALSSFKPFEMEITGIGAFPKIENPRIIWAGAASPDNILTSMAAALERKLLEAGFPNEERDFAPHITLGRLKSSTGKSTLIKALKNYPWAEPLQQRINEVTVFQSILSPQGPRYEVLKSIKLTYLRSRNFANNRKISI